MGFCFGFLLLFFFFVVFFFFVFFLSSFDKFISGV